MNRLISNFSSKLSRALQTISFSRLLVGILLLIALILGGLTFLSFQDTQVFSVTSQNTVLLLTLDLVALLLLAIIVAYKLVKSRSHSKRGRASARLQARLIRWFGIMVITPAMLITLFSVLFFNLGIESWFSNRVQTALQQSTEIAEAYLSEHKKRIKSEAKTLANVLAEALPELAHDPEKLTQFLNQQTQAFALPEAVIFTDNLRLLARSHLAFDLLYEAPSAEDLKNSAKSAVLYETNDKDRVRALIKISPSMPVYLLVGRFVDPKVLSRIEKTKSAVAEYHSLESLRADFEIKFILMFIVVSLLLLMLVVWIAMIFANRLARPIGNLIEGAEQVSAGNLDYRVPVEEEKDELTLLGTAFNQMTEQLDIKTRKLIAANQQIDRRRYFIETILSGVSAGVLGLNAEGKINVANQSAALLLKSNLDELKGKHFSEVIPEMAELLAGPIHGMVQSQIKHSSNGITQTLLIRIGIDYTGDVLEGYVVTFDDISELLNAQRKAAWGDVARRIAHEIKNPLTPIQLSAERLKNRYLPLIKESPESFERYVATIIRQVSHIEEMVNEFSEFARMPAPRMKTENIVELCEQAIFLQKSAHPDIIFDIITDTKHLDCQVDAAQIGRVLTNLLQNAIDSLTTYCKSHDEFTGKIVTSIKQLENWIIIDIDDNGKGFPDHARESLLEPYVTFREQGTGLGLAIVKRILEDHGGDLELHDSPSGGARVRMRLSTQIATPSKVGKTNVQPKSSISYGI